MNLLSRICPLGNILAIDILEAQDGAMRIVAYNMKMALVEIVKQKL